LEKPVPIKKIAFVCPYPYGVAPGQRFRYELFFEAMDKHFDYKVFSFLDEKTNAILYKPGYIFQKVVGVARGFLKRSLDIFSIIGYDYVFVFRECSPLGPPIFEFILAKIFRKKLIYDFDDAIWLPNTTSENRISALLKWHTKAKSICKWSYKISCGNAYLASFAQQHSASVVIFPTIVDTDKQHKYLKQHSNKKPIVIGWTGTHSTLKYLDAIVPVLQVLEKNHDIEFLVIADKKPALPLEKLRFVKWKESSEIEDLMQIDIGVMPLADTEWEKGKCGFKAIQYMALGIPAVVSPVGVNSSIVEDNVNGFLCSTPDEWENRLSELIKNVSLREQMGSASRKKIIDHYSVSALKQTFFALFE
jgi:glycosyltransferase involved in cell wall biosynthesis